jgi:thioredoxin-related protein
MSVRNPLKMLKRTSALILAWLLIAPAIAAKEANVPFVWDLAKVSKEAKSREVPILVLFMTDGCHFCERVMEEFLLPMQRNPEYQRKVIMRKLDIAGTTRLIDFSGGKTTYNEFAGFSGVFLAPTVMLFDPSGNVLTKPLIGLTTPDYYGGYLDEAIDEALSKLRDAGKAANKAVTAPHP